MASRLSRAPPTCAWSLVPAIHARRETSEPLAPMKLWCCRRHLQGEKTESNLLYVSFAHFVGSRKRAAPRKRAD